MSNTSPFWTAYNTALKNRILPGIPLPKDNEIFPLPFTTPLTSATDPLTAEQVNYLVYNLGNTTLATDGSKGAYASDLNTYLNTVDESTLQDPAAKKKLEDAEKALSEACVAFDNVEAEAKKYYENEPPPKPPFEQWVINNYPPYTDAKRTLDSAQSVRDSAYKAYRGRLDTLHEYQEKLKKALDTTTLYQSYNMAVQKGSTSIFKPAYSSVSLKDQLNNWIQGNGQEQTLFDVKIDSGTPTSTTNGSGIYLKFITKGLGKYDVRPSQWDVPGVRTLYPDRKSGAPDVLDPKFALPLSFLVAYAPRLEVEIRDGQSTQLLPAAPAANDKPYITVLGILGQHFPAK
ncbi:hypothetical protein K435DRAFT_968984 [Dendrothele bispora CBS 962.96]|uniref:Uncharacterized protein n=1 Tax=Dendrothele bispora (strain CBS 962.96) TaxID=1314807 RepID=A0A4S8LKJ5_DENBC|nr:hypothetical protein K435DRAFT_968984 [Dendrothele bispora CBS 962.96]